MNGYILLSITGILEKGEENDILMNVNMADNERYKESVENKKKKPAYNPYDDSQIDEFGMVLNIYLFVSKYRTKERYKNIKYFIILNISLFYFHYIL